MGQAFDCAFDTVQITIQPPPIIETGIIEPRLDIELGNLLHILGVKLEVGCQILLDLPIDHALGNNRSAAVDSPCKSHLYCCLVVFLAQIDQQWLVDDSLHVRDFLAPARLSVKVIHVAERTELDHMDALLLEPLIELFLLEIRVNLHLVHCWDLYVYTLIYRF